MSTQWKITAWIIYSLGAAILLLPFFYGEWLKLLGISIIIGFFAGILNNIVQLLIKIHEKSC